MQNTELLRDILNQHFNWNKAKLKFTIKFIITLFIVRSVNFIKIANKLHGAKKRKFKI